MPLVVGCSSVVGCWLIIFVVVFFDESVLWWWLKPGLLHSIVVMIVFVFVLHLSHTCLFKFVYICGGFAMVHGGVWKPLRQSLFLFVGYWSFRIVVGLLLWILSAVWWCARCAETSRWFLALSSSCNCCYLLVVCFFLSDPGPIIVYACQALTDSLTDWRPFGTDVTTLLKMEWIDPCWRNEISKQCWNWNEIEV